MISKADRAAMRARCEAARLAKNPVEATNSEEFPGEEIDLHYYDASFGGWNRKAHAEFFRHACDLPALLDALDEMEAELDWAYCAWCGHKGKKIPEAMAEHAVECESSPLAAAFAENQRLREALRIAANQLEGCSIGVAKHGQNIDVAFFIRHYQEAGTKARAALGEDTEGK